MAIIARFSFDVPFGKKSDLFKVIKKWESFGEELGFPRPEVLVGSIGTPESRVEINHRHLDRHGDGWDGVREGVSTDDGWPLYLERYATHLAA